jgi:hypothetical protein
LETSGQGGESEEALRAGVLQAEDDEEEEEEEEEEQVATVAAAAAAAAKRERSSSSSRGSARDPRDGTGLDWTGRM